MAKYRKKPVRRNNARQQKNWRLFASIALGAVIVLAGIGLVVGITVSNANSGDGSCPPGYVRCPITGNCEWGGCPG